MSFLVLESFDEEERAGCFAFIVFSDVLLQCSVIHPHGAVE